MPRKSKQVTVSIPEADEKIFRKIAKKYYQGNASAAVVDGLKLLAKSYRHGKVIAGRRLAAID